MCLSAFRSHWFFIVGSVVVHEAVDDESVHAAEMTNPWDLVSFHLLLLDEFHHVFAKDKYDLGKTNLVKHHIDTGDEPQVKQKPRRLSTSGTS